MANLKPGNSKGSSNLPTIPIWCLGLILAIWIAGYFAAGLVEQLLLTNPHRAAIHAHLKTEATRYQNDFNKQIARIIERADAIVQDPGTLEAVKASELPLSRWQESARTLRALNPQTEWLSIARSRLPDAERIFLIKPDKDKTTLSGNYVAALLIEDAFVGETPPPIAARTEQWNIYIARPVFEGTRVAGVLLIEYRPSVFQKIVGPTDGSQGRVSLIQAVENFRDVVVFFEGTGWKDEFSTSVQTRVKDWKIRYTASKRLVDSLEPGPLPYYAALAVLLLMLAALSVYLVRKTIVFPQREIKPSRRLDPRDDLFTEKYVRSNSGRESPRPAETAAETTPPPAPPEETRLSIPEHVFRDYDIRGKAHSEISPDFARLLGQTMGTLMLQCGEHSLMICADGRTSSPRIKKAFNAGVLATGCDLIDIGQAPTPVLNYALANVGDCSSGVMITASHNPKDDNGFKIFVNRKPLPADQIKSLRNDMLEGNFISAEGDLQKLDFIQKYIDHVVEDIVPPSELRIAIDCGNGISSVVAPSLFRSLGCQVKELCTEVDGNFPHHDPDPTVSENLRLLISTVINEELDMGLAFDGDGDRVVAVTGSGRIVWPDELLMIFARDVVSRNPGADIIYDVKSTRRLNDLVTSYGGRPVMWKTGHAHMRNKVAENHAPLGGEFSGHIFFSDRWFGFDDGLYAAARLLEIISLREQSLDEIIDSFPSVCATEEIKIPTDEAHKVSIVKAFQDNSNFGDAHLVTIDGLRVEYANGWGLLRASNTSAALTLRFEADTEPALMEIIADFREKLRAVDAKLAVHLENPENLPRSGISDW